MGEVHCRILSSMPAHTSHTHRCPQSLPDAILGLSSDLREPRIFRRCHRVAVSGWELKTDARVPVPTSGSVASCFLMCKMGLRLTMTLSSLEDLGARARV